MFVCGGGSVVTQHGEADLAHEGLEVLSRLLDFLVEVAEGGFLGKRWVRMIIICRVLAYNARFQVTNLASHVLNVGAFNGLMQSLLEVSLPGLLFGLIEGGSGFHHIHLCLLI